MLSERLEFAPERDAELFSAVPAGSAVYLLRSANEKAEPYVSKTANLRLRLQRLLGLADEPTKKLNLRDRITAIEFSPTGSDFESRFILYQVLRSTFPQNYSNRLRLRFAPLVKLHIENEYPRASVTRRLGRLDGGSAYFGPFLSRAVAEKFMNDSLDFFKMRRCVDDLHPDPAFPGCIYSEMKMCLAPCFKGCSDQDYAEEVFRVQAFFDSAGESLERELSLRREAASTKLEFEEAAAIHQRMEKLKPVLQQLPEIVRGVDKLSGLLVQTSHVSNCVTFFRILSGALSGPITFNISSFEHAKSQSMESRVQQAIDGLAPAEANTFETMEHLALLKRWYYRSRRVGEIFLTDESGDLPMRRIVRGIGRVLRGEAPEADGTQSLDRGPKITGIQNEES